MDSSGGMSVEDAEGETETAAGTASYGILKSDVLVRFLARAGSLDEFSNHNQWLRRPRLHSLAPRDFTFNKQAVSCRNPGSGFINNRLSCARTECCVKDFRNLSQN